MKRPFTPAWLSGDPVATGFLARGFDDVAARREAVFAARERHLDAAVLAAVAAQEARRPWSGARAQNLELLGRGAAVVATGQQVGLLLGPLYTLHKAASTVVNARALAAETGHPVVPLFWLQTEDHDFAEVRGVTLPSPSGLALHQVADQFAGLAASGDPGAARVSLSERRLGASITEVLGQLALEGPHAAEVMGLLGRYYRPDATFGEAFGNVLTALFAEHGLLVFDPRAKLTRDEVARLAAPVHGFALRRAEAIAAALGERAEALAAAGFAVQVAPRAGASLSCYAPEGGGRQRLERGADGWSTKHPLALSEGDLELLLRTAPERFTTTALLRPLVQDTLFPTAAYVGGPGEIGYLAELPPLYALADLPMPLAVPRARFTLVTATARRLGEQLGLEPAQARLPRTELAALLAQRAPEGEAMGEEFASLERALAEGFVALASEAARLGDEGFGRHARKAEETMRGALARLCERSRRLALERDAVTAERLTRFQALLAPGGEPQERVLGWASFAAQIGPRELIDRLVQEARPFDGAHRTIEL